jgi:hypothetical protein
MSTYKVTYRTIRNHEAIGDYYADTDYVRVIAKSAAQARSRVTAAAQTADIRIKIMSTRNEDAAYERRIHFSEARRARVTA